MSDYTPGDAFAAADPPPYPREWGSEQRLSAYWCAIRIRRFPTHTQGWYGIVSLAERMRNNHPDPMLYNDDADDSPGF